MLVAFVGILAILLPFLQPHRMSAGVEVSGSLVTFIFAVAVIWFAVRRAQRGQTASPRFTIVMIILAAICFILAEIFKRFQ